MKRSFATSVAAVLALTLVTGCGQQIAGTSAARSAAAPSSPIGTPTTVAPQTVKGTAAVTQPVTPARSPAVTVTATPAPPETVTQMQPPVIVLPPERVTVTQAPSTVYYPRGSSAADQQVAADWLTAEAMVDSWIPQLSSNPDSASAMAKYRTLSASYGGVFMVASADFTSFRSSGYYVTMIAVPFGTAAQANAWCDAQGFPAVDCLAKVLSHTRGPDGLTVERG